MNTEFKRMQELAGVKLQENYELDESAAENLELKSFARQLFAYAKKNGAIAKYLDFNNPDKIKDLGKRKEGMEFRQTPHLYINVRKDDIYVNMVGDGVENLYKEMADQFSKFEFGNYSVSKELFGKATLPLVSFTVKPKTTGKKGGVMATEALNEVYVAGGIVGVGAINHPKREKSDYEMAFEHFMTEGKEEVEEESHNMARPGTERETEKEEMDEGYYEEDDTMEEAVSIPAEASAIRDAVRKMMKDNPNDSDLGAAIRKKFAK